VIDLVARDAAPGDLHPEQRAAALSQPAGDAAARERHERRDRPAGLRNAAHVESSNNQGTASGATSDSVDFK